jgi:hypothetical protein
MINAIQHWTQRHPYSLTGLLFLAMVLFGGTALGWGERQLGFLLLIYFIVALGIRLDEITRTLGGPPGSAHARAEDSDTVIAHLRDIKELLRRIDSKLQPPASEDDREQRP